MSARAIISYSCFCGDYTDTYCYPQVEKIFPVTRIKIYPYFYDPFLPNSSRALRNFKSLCAVPVYTRNGPVTVHVIKLLLVEKFPFIVLNSPFFPLFPEIFSDDLFFFFFFFLGATSFFTPLYKFFLPPKNFFLSLKNFHPLLRIFFAPAFPKYFPPPP